MRTLALDYLSKMKIGVMVWQLDLKAMCRMIASEGSEADGRATANAGGGKAVVG